jgi:ABC-type dipeptide/oligopeptide/nickel transport system permease component
VLFSHVLRNALLPVVTMLGMDVGVALGGAVFTETVYQLHGLGWTLTNAVSLNDFSVVEGIVVFATIAVLSLNLLIDILYAFIDPRIRLA